MKKILAILLVACLCLGACAFAEAGPEYEAALHIIAYGGEAGQYPLGYSGTLTAATLMDGLTALTGFNFAATVEVNGTDATVTWADDADCLPGGKPPMEIADPELTFYDYDSVLQFMLDTTRATLMNNLGVENVRFATSVGGGLSFPGVTAWSLAADEPYSGDFYAYYPDAFVFVDARKTVGDPGENLTAEEAAQFVEDALITGYEGKIDADADWYVVLENMTEMDGSEGYEFAVGQGSDTEFTEYFRAVVTYDGGIYLREAGADDYIFHGNWSAE